MNVCHGGNFDDLVSTPAMTGTVVVNFCVYFNGLYKNIYINTTECKAMYLEQGARSYAPSLQHLINKLFSPFQGSKEEAIPQNNPLLPLGVEQEDYPLNI